MKAKTNFIGFSNPLSSINMDQDRLEFNGAMHMYVIKIHFIAEITNKAESILMGTRFGDKN